MFTINSMPSQRLSRQFHLSVYIACIAFAWFALSGSVSRLISYVKGDTVSMWVCTQTGLKKITIPSEGVNNPQSSGDIKHCGDSPIYKQIALPATPKELNFEQPQTVATWRLIQTLQSKPDLLKNKRRPPGQAPPVAVA